jgi:hypothetical protein
VPKSARLLKIGEYIAQLEAERDALRAALATVQRIAGRESTTAGVLVLRMAQIDEIARSALEGK